MLDRERFERLWGRCCAGGGAAGAGEAFARVAAGYAEPHRRYHTEAHILHCLEQFDLAAAEVGEPDALELAVWFHDVIYEPDAPDNERRSADLFLELAGPGAEPALRERVERLIMATVHRAPPAGPDAGYMVDIDLSSFGLPWERFLRDSVAVREEFPHIPDAEFYARQIEFLGMLLARPRFCFTEFFRARHERRARANIRRYLDSLLARGYRSASGAEPLSSV